MPNKKTQIISIIDPRHRDPKPSWDPVKRAASKQFAGELFLVAVVVIIVLWLSRQLGTYPTNY